MGAKRLARNLFVLELSTHEIIFFEHTIVFKELRFVVSKCDFIGSTR